MKNLTIEHGQLHCGSDCVVGEGVVVDVDEEVVIGDRCVIAPGTYFEGRRVEIGDDFFGYDWSHQGRALDVGRGRRGEEFAILRVGARCTFHDNRIDLARQVTIGDDVGLSPEVVIYTHGYWLSALEGFPCAYAPVAIGNGVIIGFRSTVLPGAGIADRSVVGAGAVVSGVLTTERGVYGGVPAKLIRTVKEFSHRERMERFNELVSDYQRSLKYRNLSVDVYRPQNWPMIWCAGAGVDLVQGVVSGRESEYSDDLRWFLFTRGIRVYTKRPFRRLEKR